VKLSTLFKTSFLLLTVFVVSGVSICAQVPPVSEESLNADSEYSIKIWDRENGAPQNQIRSILQTSDGFIWFISDNKLVRFDGVHFKSFNSKNTANFPGNITMIFSDNRKNVCLLSHDTLFQFSTKGIKTLSLGKPDLIFTYGISEGEGDAIFLGTNRGEVYKLVNNSFVFICKVPYSVTSVKCMSDSTLYVGTEKGLFRFSAGQISITRLIGAKPIRSIKLDKEGVLYVLGYYDLFRIKNDAVKPVKLPVELMNKDIGSYILDFLLDNDKIWVSSKTGVAIVDAHNFSYQLVERGISTHKIYGLLKDRENNIWLNAGNAGLNKLKLKVVRSYGESENYFGSSAGSVVYDSVDDELFIANYCDGLYRYKAGAFKLDERRKRHCLWALMLDNKRSLWIGCLGSGVVKYNRSGASVVEIVENLESKDVRAIYEDQDHFIWIGTDNGANIYKNGRLEAFDLLRGYSIKRIVGGRDGSIWFCTTGGLVHYKDGILRVYSTRDGLANNHVRDVYEDKQNTFWITTYGGGIARLKEGTVFAYGKLNALINPFTSVIMEDDFGNLWVTTNNGIYSISKAELNDYAVGKSSFVSPFYHGRESGMRYTECNGGFQSPGIRNNRGRFVFPTINGIVEVDPSRYSRSDYVPEPFFEGVWVNKELVSSDDSLVKIKGQQSSLEIHFNAPYFSERRNLIFQYKLEGKDEEWSTTNTVNSIKYADLPTGEYKFKIRIYGSENRFLNKEKVKLIRVFPSFWETSTFIYVALAFCTMLFLIIVYIRVRMIRKNEATKTEINKNYAALELKALKGQMNPHFIFNCLNTIKFFITVDDKMSAGKYLAKFANLVRLVLNNSNNNYHTLRTEVEVLSLYVELEQLRLDKSFDFSMLVDPELDMDKIKVPGMLFQPFIENAIHHGIRESEKRGKISVFFRTENDLFSCTIEDNGIGRDESKRRRDGLLKNKESTGIRNTKDRIDSINFVENTSIKLEIIDKMDANKVPEGTLVRILIPMNLRFEGNAVLKKT